MPNNSFVIGFILGCLTCGAVGATMKMFEKKQNYSKIEEEKKEEPENKTEKVEEEEEEEEEDQKSFFARMKELVKRHRDDLPKMILCVRTDLGMQKGKMCAQCAHAALGAYEEGMENESISDIIDLWQYTGCAKIALKVNSLEELEQISKEAEQQNINQFTVCDAGRTQIAPGSITVLAIGPDYASKIDSITGPKGTHPLKLL